MIYTTLHGCDNHELLLLVANKDDATDLELELALRVELLLDELESQGTKPKRRLFSMEEMRGQNA